MNFVFRHTVFLCQIDLSGTCVLSDMLFGNICTFSLYNYRKKLYNRGILSKKKGITMLGILNFSNPVEMITNLLLSVPITLIALTGHEFAHGWVSSRLGDPTPRMEGRLTLNPLAHLDLIGTIMMMLTGFGWAKPVGVNPMYYKNRKGGMALVAAAGPLANLIMAFVGMLIWGIFVILYAMQIIPLGVVSFASMFCQMFALRNIGFMVFNLIPIPPLDGWKVVGMFVPDRIYYRVLQYERYALLLIMALSLIGALDSILWFGYSHVYTALYQIVNLLVTTITGLIA